MTTKKLSSQFPVAQQISRGWILDIFVFIVNLFLMRLLVEYFLDVVYAAKKGDSLSLFTITAFLYIFTRTCTGRVVSKPLAF